MLGTSSLQLMLPDILPATFYIPHTTYLNHELI